jgi:amino acid adenylation domain-containing protein
VTVAVARLDEALIASAERYPERPALTAGGEVLSYVQLDRAVFELAGRLADAGLGSGDRIGVLVPKGIPAVLGIYAGLRLGALVAPLDATDPPERIARMAANAGLRYLLTDARTEATARRVQQRLSPAQAQPGGAGALTHGLSWHALPGVPARPVPAEVAGEGGYILFTSGSTGRPKGVLLSHRNVLHFARWAAEEFGLEPGDRIGAQASFTFDLSTFDLFSSALAGACVHLMPEHLRLFPADVVSWLDQEQITVFYAVPSLYQGMLLDGEIESHLPSRLRLVAFAGEPFPPQLLERYVRAAPRLPFYNLYGPTETNVCTYERLPDGWTARDGVSVGRAIDGDLIEVVGEDGRYTDGEGEIHVAGATVFLGYLVDCALTDPTRQVRFRDGTVHRAYPTGDIGRFGPDGRLHLIGRRDHQVKRRGHRIDLLDIESVLLELSGVRTAAVVAKTPQPHAGEIWAYVVAESLPGAQVHAALTEALPRRMLPDRVVLVDRLPVTERGKIDRRQLSARSA